MKRILLAALCLMGCAMMQAQVTTEPAIVPLGYTGEITIVFNPNEGTGGMVGATKCYAHTGITYNGQSWQQTGTWRDGKDKYKMTKNADGNWVLKITPNMFEYYGVPAGTPITQICLVFNDGPGGSKEGKAAGGRDIFIDLGEAPCEDIWKNFTPAAVTTKARPAGVVNGIYYGEDGTSVTLCTYAASKTAAAKHVFLLGDMTDWVLNNDYQLYKDGNYFWITLTGLEKGKEYRFQYVVERSDGKKVQISDLFSEKVIHPDDSYEPRSVNPDLIGYPRCGADGGYVTVIQPGKKEYEWSDATKNFKRPNKNNLVIYEMWVYDYTYNRSLKGVMKRLDYLSELGVNAIELMPVTEFDGNYNWGYSPNHYFALDKAYGTPEMLKSFVDECHKRGMAVILDMVFNHATGLNPMNKLYPYGTDLKNNPWFNVTAPHSDNVYEDWNHGFAPARDMFTRALAYWLTEYKVDGFRMDLSHGLCSDQKHTSVNNIKHYYDNGVKAISPDAYMILEHWGDAMGSERPQLVNYGMMCWNNTNNAYSQLAMGWLKDGDNISDANKDNYISYCESHDEERNYYKAKTWGNGKIKTDEPTRLARVPLTIAFNVLLNGPHMIWQYNELGYDYSINSTLGSNEIKEDNRCSKKQQPAALGWFNEGSLRMAAYQKVAQLIRLRTQLMPTVFEGNPTASSLGSGKELRTIQWGDKVFVAGNFSATNAVSVSLPSGTWYDYYGQCAAGASYTLQPGELKIFTGTKQELPQVPSNFAHFSGLEPVVSQTAPHVMKIMENGHMYILREGAAYDFTGVRVR